jgi:shikimate dehydrogenase
MQNRHLIGLVGADVAGSLSPPLYEREADELGLRLYYTTVDAGEAAAAAGDAGRLLRTARSLGFTGLNVTHPSKQAFLEHLDGLSADAATLGAVNTIVLADGRAVGHNTDLHGFATGFRRGLPGARLGTVLLVGAGGAGAAAAHALLTLGAGHIRVADIDPLRCAALVERLSAGFGSARVSALADVESGLATDLDGLVNATPGGMRSHPGVPVAVEALRPGLWVVDVIYRPLETELLRAARLAGCRTLNGGPMLVHQAARAFQLFTGHEPDQRRMLRHFDALRAKALARAE